ncbi:unnamed protein product [Toxocara canis]|uniref:Uncharacterized protein n=1 Tax=Toxocara canis TaxID=6265 RepID=A0A183U9I5_TOXCA|nr:unnamed protein product [Toxocara canis]
MFGFFFLKIFYSIFRFYFENPGIFTPDQVKELKKSTLSRVICNNGDHFELISEDAFLLPHGSMTPCTAIPQINLNKWKE